MGIEQPTVNDSASKIVRWDDVEALVRRRHARRERIVFTNGCFDLLHVGHVRLLRSARSFGDTLIVGLNSDQSVSKLKGPKRPVVSQAERAELVVALSCVDHVVIFDQPTPIELLRIVRPHIHVKGGEYAPGLGKEMPETGILRELGAEIRLVPMVEGWSTTALMDRLAAATGDR